MLLLLLFLSLAVSTHACGPHDFEFTLYDLKELPLGAVIKGNGVANDVLMAENREEVLENMKNFLESKLKETFKELFRVDIPANKYTFTKVENMLTCESTINLADIAKATEKNTCVIDNNKVIGICHSVDHCKANSFDSIQGHSFIKVVVHVPNAAEQPWINLGQTKQTMKVEEKIHQKITDDGDLFEGAFSEAKLHVSVNA